MKWVVAAAAVTLGGCVGVSELERSHETMDVMSGKSPRGYADCVKQNLATSRETINEEARGDGLRLIVPQKLGAGPAALIDIDKRGSGSSIKVFERLNNFPFRPGDVRAAATKCISGS